MSEQIYLVVSRTYYSVFFCSAREAVSGIGFTAAVNGFGRKLWVDMVIKSELTGILKFPWP